MFHHGEERKKLVEVVEIYNILCCVLLYLQYFMLGSDILKIKN